MSGKGGTGGLDEGGRGWREGSAHGGGGGAASPVSFFLSSYDEHFFERRCEK